MTKSADDSSRFARDAWLRALQRTASIEQKAAVLPSLIEDLAARHESAPALVCGESALTYRQLARRCNQYAHWGVRHGLRTGDAVCLVMTNQPEYLAVWLGLTRIGVTVALVNTHLSGAPLAHAVNLVSPVLLIVDATLCGSFAGARASLSPSIECWVFGEAAGDWAPLEPELRFEPVEPLSVADRVWPSLESTALFVYTSGTTGLPKAAKLSHRRLMQWSHWFAGMMDTGPQDRMYNCLPLYHSVGGIVATGATLVGGGAVIIRRRFSAADFWRDIREERCTLFQYIGELCRYLTAAPRDALETEHGLRLACGNGLRPEVWNVFAARFRIPRILEYYAATEGAFSLYNCEGEPGAIGRIPPFLRHRMPVELLRLDPNDGTPARDAAGFCRRCAVDETGEAIGQGRFEGYTDPGASSGKILKNVFAAGDSWYRSGDLMRRDARGFYYFVDRAGDTYRWKGENVSAAEVRAALEAVPGVLDGIVYGVAVPGYDGRAGMAALKVDSSFELQGFRDAVAERLPAYARPLFLLLLPELPMTATFKPVARALQERGFDPAAAQGTLYFNSAASRAFIPLDAPLYAAVVAGGLRL